MLCSCKNFSGVDSSNNPRLRRTPMHVHNRDRNFLLRICCLVLCSAALATAAMAAYGVESCKQLVATGNPEYPPYLWRDQADQSHLIGANADLMQMLSKEIGIPI